MTCLHRTVLLLRFPKGIVSRLRMIQDPEREEGKPATSTDGRKHPGQAIGANEVVPEGRVPCCQHLLASFFFSFQEHVWIHFLSKNLLLLLNFSLGMCLNLGQGALKSSQGLSCWPTFLSLEHKIGRQQSCDWRAEKNWKLSPAYVWVNLSLKTGSNWSRTSSQFYEPIQSEF